MAKTIYNMSEVGMREIVACPKCRNRTHPEYLTYVTDTGQVVACESCRWQIPTEAKGQR